MQQRKSTLVAEFLVFSTFSAPTLYATRSMQPWELLAWCVASIVFMIAIAYGTWSRLLATPGSRGGGLLLLILTACGFVLTCTNYREGGMFQSVATLWITVRRLPYVTTERISWSAAMAIGVGLIGVFGWRDGWMAALAGGVASTAVLAFALSHSLHDLHEREARAQLLAVNTELHATRALLAENSRAMERLRISRDLHDALGHHLTALSIQLDVATRRSEGAAAEHIREAHAIVRLLLGDVRNVVAQLRVAGRPALADQIRELASSIEDLDVRIEVPEKLAIEDAEQAETLMRCIQEVITNARRHAAARRLELRIATSDAGVDLQAQDDGVGAQHVALGHGLTGMRERFAECGGYVEVTSRPGAGFVLRAHLPARVAPT